MVATTPHPSQRRSSCDVCKKLKSKCQRFEPDDPKCAKCTLLRVPCVIGQQKAVGRPRRKALSARLTSTTEHPPPNQSNPIPAQQNNSSLGNRSQFGWRGLSPEPTMMAQDAGHTTSTWHTGFIDLFGQSVTSSSFGNDLENNDTPEFMGFDFRNTIPSQYSIETPPDPASPLYSLTYSSATHHLQNVDPSKFMFNLTQMNLDLHVRLEAMKKIIATLDFDLMIVQQSPLYIDRITLAEFSIKASYDFLSILTKLNNDQHVSKPLGEVPERVTLFSKALSSSFRKNMSKSQDLSDSSQTKCDTVSEQLPAPIVLMITSIFVQLLSIYEVILHSLTARIERMAVDPSQPIQVPTVSGQPLERPCTQGMVFCEVLVILMTEIERLLGIGGKESGLLSPRQVEALANELDGRHEVLPGYSILSPAVLRRLLGKIADMLRSIQ